MGFNPADIGLFHYANEMGLGVADLDQIEVLGTPIEDVTVSFQPHEKVEFQFQWQETKQEQDREAF